MVRKLYKVFDKPASTLGFWMPGVVSKEPRPLGLSYLDVDLDRKK